MVFERLREQAFWMFWKEPELMELRTEFALWALKKEKPFRELCQDYGISPKTGYKWLERHRQTGKRGMADRSRKPRSNPGQLEEAVVCRIVKLKLGTGLGLDWAPFGIRSDSEMKMPNRVRVTA